MCTYQPICISRSLSFSLMRSLSFSISLSLSLSLSLFLSFFFFNSSAYPPLSLYSLSLSISFNLSLSLRPYLSLCLTLCLPFLKFSDFLSSFYSFSVSLSLSSSISIAVISVCLVSFYLLNAFLSLPPVTLRSHSHEKYNRHQTISDSKSPDT